MKSISIMFLLTMVLVSAVAANDTIKPRHSSLYMDVTVHEVKARNVTFVNSAGDEFNFTDVAKAFKVGERTTLEVEADFAGEWFRVINMRYVVQDTRFVYPDNKHDEGSMFMGLGAIILAVAFAVFLIGRMSGKPRPNRRIHNK